MMLWVYQRIANNFQSFNYFGDVYTIKHIFLLIATLIFTQDLNNTIILLSNYDKLIFFMLINEKNRL